MGPTFHGKRVGMALETSLRLLPIHSHGHLPLFRMLRVFHPSCRCIPPLVWYLPFRHRHSRPQKSRSADGMTAGILLMHQLLSLGVLILMRGMLLPVSPCRFPVVQLGHNELTSITSHSLRRLFAPALCFIILDADSYLMILTQNSHHPLQYLNGTLFGPFSRTFLSFSRFWAFLIYIGLPSGFYLDSCYHAFYLKILLGASHSERG